MATNLAQILHLLSASLVDAQAVLSAASSAGFRESGAMGLSTSSDGNVSPMVAVRSTGLGFDSIIGYQNANGDINSLVTEEYLELMVGTANEKFRINAERIERFKTALMSYYSPSTREPIGGRGPEFPWEDKDARRARKRAEGLAKQREQFEKGKETHIMDGANPELGYDKDSV
jgi:tRNA wybutosine-synthesizing protein 3